MRTIEESELTATLDACLCEVFELMVKQCAHLEVLTNEEDFVGTLYEFSPDIGLYNASCFYQRNETSYAFEQEIEKGNIKVTYFAFDDLSEALAFANDLLKKHAC